MTRKPAIILAAIGATAALLVGGCSNGDGSDKLSDSGYTQYEQLPVDPYTSNGTWKVPEQIKPGRYRVTANTDPVVTLRWYVMCADPFCEDTISETTRYASAGGDFVTIPNDSQCVDQLIPGTATTSCVSVKGFKNNGVKLEPVE